AFLFLPPERRRAITALYAFCREVDDVEHEAHEESGARMKLVWWRSQVAELYQGRTQHPVTNALAPHVQAFGLPDAQLLAVIDGTEMDLDHARYQSWEDLKRYCWHAAGVVGLLSARIFGQTQEQTSDCAQKLGLAFQLTNIIPAVGAEARRGRIYLPRDELERLGVRAWEILDHQPSGRFEAMRPFQTERARGLYREA